MAISIYTTPALLGFAGNPIIYKAKTNHVLGEGESFLRIVCKAVFTVNGSVPDYSGNTSFSVELSQPVEDAGMAVFNLSDAAQTLLVGIQAQMDMNSGNGLASLGIYADVSFSDVWLAENNEVTGSTETASRIYVVPGRLTDFELLTMTDIYLPSLAGSGRMMSRKPDGGIVYAGETLIVPTLRGSDASSVVSSSSFSVEGTVIASSSDYVQGYKMDSQFIALTNKSVEGAFEYVSSLTASFSGHYRTNTAGVHFLRFINGFGAVENIAVRSKDKLSYSVEGEVHSLVQEASVRPTDRRYAVKSQPVGAYELSSGYVPQRWAEWYVQELLTSPRVWIQLGGKWVPALIEAEDDCVIYDRTKPEMPHVDFTLRLAIDGVTGCTW